MVKPPNFGSPSPIVDWAVNYKPTNHEVPDSNPARDGVQSVTVHCFKLSLSPSLSKCKLNNVEIDIKYQVVSIIKFCFVEKKQKNL